MSAISWFTGKVSWLGEAVLVEVVESATTSVTDARAYAWAR